MKNLTARQHEVLERIDFLSKTGDVDPPTWMDLARGLGCEISGVDYHLRNLSRMKLVRWVRSEDALPTLTEAGREALEAARKALKPKNNTSKYRHVACAVPGLAGKPAQKSTVRAETVEEFRARGQEIKRVPAPWERGNAA